MSTYIRSLVKHEIGNIVSTILILVLMFFGLNFAAKTVTEFVENNERRHEKISRQMYRFKNDINEIDHELFHLNKDIEEINSYDSYSESSDSSSSCDSNEISRDSVSANPDEVVTI